MRHTKGKSPGLGLKALTFAYWVVIGLLWAGTWSAQTLKGDAPAEGEVEFDVVREFVKNHCGPSDHGPEVEALREENISNWRKAVEDLREAGGNAQLKVFFGTWCHDSKRELPQLVEIFDELKRGRRSPFQEVRWFVVDAEKQKPAEEIDRFRVRHLPTLVVSRRGRELGRIVQQPPRSLEVDLKRLLDGSALGLVTASEKIIREHLRPLAPVSVSQEIQPLPSFEALSTNSSGDQGGPGIR